MLHMLFKEFLGGELCYSFPKFSFGMLTLVNYLLLGDSFTEARISVEGPVLRMFFGSGD